MMLARQQGGLGVQRLPWILAALTLILVLSQYAPAALLGLWPSWAEIGILAMGMTATVLTGGIDLSVGSTVALGGMTLGLLWQKSGWPLGLAAAACVTVGFGAGALNGALVITGISPLVATLGTMAFYAGLAMALAGGTRIAGLPESFTWLGQGRWAGIPYHLYFLAAVFAVVAVAVHQTRFGRYLYAIGENRTAAVFAGVPVRAIEWTLYAVNGTLAGIVAILYTARGGAAVPDPRPEMELQVVACVVLGGTRITGGRGGVGRTLLGLAILAHLQILLQGSFRLAALGIEGRRIGTDVRLLLVGALVIVVAIVNERATKHHRD